MVQEALHITTRILPGGRIDIAAPQLQPGESVDVFILRGYGPAPAAMPVRRSAVDILADAPAHRLFNDADQVDAYVQQQRNSWDR